MISRARAWAYVCNGFREGSKAQFVEDMNPGALIARRPASLDPLYDWLLRQHAARVGAKNSAVLRDDRGLCAPERQRFAPHWLPRRSLCASRRDDRWVGGWWWRRPWWLSFC